MRVRTGRFLRGVKQQDKSFRFKAELYLSYNRTLSVLLQELASYKFMPMSGVHTAAVNPTVGPVMVLAQAAKPALVPPAGYPER
jgi:hypothetical protein